MRSRFEGKPIVIGVTPDKRRVVLTPDDREAHMELIGLPGFGKSKCIERMVREDILAGHGVILLDPKGNLHGDVVSWVASRGLGRKRKVITIDPTLPEFAVLFNPLNFGGGAEHDISAAVDSIVLALSSSKNCEDLDQMPRFLRCIRAVLTITAEQGRTLLDAFHLLSAYDPHGLAEYLSSNIKDPVIAEDWMELSQLAPREKATTFESARNRLAGVLASRALRLMFSQVECTIDFRRLMDEGAVVLVNLYADGVSFSETQAKTLGRLLVNDICRSARRRLRVGGREPKPCYFYIDECQNFLNEDIARGLAELRQNGLRFILSHQTLAQLEAAGPEVVGAVRGAAELKVVFRSFNDDADALAPQLFRSVIDLEEPKEVLTRRAVVGHEIGTLSSWSSSTSHASGRSGSRSLSRGRSRGRSAAESYGSSHGYGSSTGYGSSHGYASSEGSGSSEGSASSEGRGWSTGSGESIGSMSATAAGRNTAIATHMYDDGDHAGELAEYPHLQTMAESESGSSGFSRGRSRSDGESGSAAESTSASKSKTRGESRSSGESRSRGESESTSLARSRSSASSHAESEAESESKGWSESHSQGFSEGKSEALIPVYEDQVGAVYSLEEQLFRKGTLLARLPRSVAIVKKRDDPVPIECHVMHVEDAKIQASWVAREKRLIMERSGCAQLAAELEQKVIEREAELRRLAAATDDEDPVPDTF